MLHMHYFVLSKTYLLYEYMLSVVVHVSVCMKIIIKQKKKKKILHVYVTARS